MTRRPLSIVTALWGEWHIEHFSAFVLPSLLHPSNLPALAERVPCVWRIHTKAEDVQRIEHIVEPARKFMAVEVTTNGGAAGRHYRDAWRHEHEAASRCGSLAMFLPPDVVWSIGSFTHIGDLLARGVSMLFTSHPRSRPSALYADPRMADDLMRQVMAYDHPLNKSHEYESMNFTRHPEMVIWPVRGACVVRMFAREVFVCDPVEVKFNGSNLPDAIGSRPHVVGLSDDAFGVSLAPDSHDQDNYTGNGRLCSSEFVARWVLSYNSPANKWLASQPVVWRYGDVDAEELGLAIKISAQYADDVFRLAA